MVPFFLQICEISNIKGTEEYHTSYGFVICMVLTLTLKYQRNERDFKNLLMVVVHFFLILRF